MEHMILRLTCIYRHEKGEVIYSTRHTRTKNNPPTHVQVNVHYIRTCFEQIPFFEQKVVIKDVGAPAREVVKS